MSTKSQGACAACRIRKAKCIPGTPRCVRCVTLGIQDCRYAPVKKRGAGSILRMGEACVPCRQKKSKCDAKQPCTTCVIRDGGAACTYEGPRSGGRVLYLRERSPTPSKRLKWIPSPHVLERTAPVLSSDTSVIEEACETTECPPPPTMPSLTILPSIRFQAIPRPLPLPSSIIPAERLQVSWGPGNDLDMSFRLRALCQLNKLGLYFIPEKQEAIIRGDTSNSVIHRHFVDGAHVMGVHFCGPEVTPAVVRLQARYSQTSWESLIQLNQTNQERDKAQALLLVAYSCVIVGLNAGPQLYLLKACKIIEKAGLQFLPESGLPVEYSEQVREDASVLSQAIYLENYVHLTLGGSAPAKTARIEREFRTGLQRVYPCLFEICPLTMRTQSILLVRDAIHALNSPVDKAEDTSDEQTLCLDLVHALDTFSADLIRTLQWFVNIGDTSGAETVWTCCVICLAHLAALCHFVSQADTPSSLSMNDLYDLTVAKLGNLSLEVRIEVYTHFDILTGWSWKMALDTIDARLGLHLDGEKGSLRDWKGVIGKAYDDFRANLPGHEPATFLSLVLTTDGRSEGSNFPNLAMPAERERYGV